MESELAYELESGLVCQVYANHMDKLNPDVNFGYETDPDPNHVGSWTVTAHKDGVVVGLHQFQILIGAQNQYVYVSLGTWTHRKWQGQGIASGLWDLGLDLGVAGFDIKRVAVATITDRGHTLVLALMDRYPDLVWDMESLCTRAPHDLRKYKYV